MFFSIGCETLPSDYSDDFEAHIPLLSLQGTHTWFRPSTNPYSASSLSSRSASVATSATSVTNYKTLLTPSATSLLSQDSSLTSEVEIEWDRKYEILLMSLWSLVYFSTLFLGTILLIWGFLGRRVWGKVVGGLFVGTHVLVCVGMAVVDAHFDGMESIEIEGNEREEV